VQVALTDTAPKHSNYQKLAKNQVKGVLELIKERVPMGLTELYEEVRKYKVLKLQKEEE